MALAHPFSRCKKTYSIVTPKRGVCACAGVQGGRPPFTSERRWQHPHDGPPCVGVPVVIGGLPCMGVPAVIGGHRNMQILPLPRALVAAQGNGSPCGHAHGAKLQCRPGEGRCRDKNANCPKTCYRRSCAY